MEYDLPQLTLRQLEYLISVGEAGSIARDFEALNVSSSSKSAAVSQLEKELGFSLFVRRQAQELSQTSGNRNIIEEAKSGAFQQKLGEILK